MDTRTKIIDAAEAVRLAEGAVVVSGYFDPLLSSHAERLADLKREGSPLMVVIASPVGPILPARARAELVAGLRVVDYVTECAIEASVRLEQEDSVRFGELVARVHARQAVAS